MDESKAGSSKRKTQRSSNTPYSRSQSSKSFLSQVTDSVKELLTPSWLTSLVSSGSTAQDDGKVKELDVSKVLAEVGGASSGSGVDRQQTAYNPSAYGGPSHTLQRQPSEVQAGHYQYMAGEDSAVPIVLMTQSVNGAPFSSAGYPQQAAYAQPSHNQPQPGGSGALNGYQMFPSGQDRAGMEPERQRVSRASRHASYLEDKNATGIDNSILNDSTDANQSMSLNISTFARSFNESMNSSMLNSRNMTNSSFYTGKTVYGGKSSKRAFHLPTASPYRRVSKTSTKGGGVSKVDSKPAVTSKAAKLILKALDETGLDQNNTERKTSLFSPAVYLRKREGDVSGRRMVSTPPLSRMPKSSKATIARSVHRPEVEAVSKKASRSSVRVEEIYATSSAGGKLKRDRSQSHYNANRSYEEEVLPVPDLSTHYTLSVGNMPTFNFGQISSNSSTVGNFSFSSPEGVSTGVRPSNSPSPTLGDFTFASPAKADQTAEVSKIFPNGLSAAATASASQSKLNVNAPAFTPQVSKPASTGWGDLFKAPAGKWSCSACLLENDKDIEVCAACKSAAPSVSKSAVKQGAVVPASGWGDLMKQTSDKWNCSDCLLQNNKEEAKCVACGAKNPSAVSAAAPAVSQTAASSGAGWGDLFKQAGNKWSCSDCLLQNEESVTSCAACGTKNPSSTPKTFATQSSGATGWGDLMKNVGAKWGCSDCLLQNDSEANKCVACGASNPAASTNAASAQPPAAAAQPPAASAGSGWGTMFSQAGEKWGCSDCLVQNDQKSVKCVACGAKNPSLAKPAEKSPAPTSGAGWGDLFKQTGNKWSCSGCLLQNEESVTSCVACGTKNPSASAGKPPVAENSTKPLATASGWGNFLSKPEGQWNCGVCMGPNPADKDSCMACCTARPSSSQPSKQSSQANSDLTGTSAAGWSTGKPVNSWGSFGSQPATTWSCSTCLVPNQANVSLCVACGACKPGTQSSLGDLNKGKQLPIYQPKPLTNIAVSQSSSTKSSPAPAGLALLSSVKHPSQSKSVVSPSKASATQAPVGLALLSAVKHPSQTSTPAAPVKVSSPVLPKPTASSPKASGTAPVGLALLSSVKHPSQIVGEKTVQFPDTKDKVVSAGFSLKPSVEKAAGSTSALPPTKASVGAFNMSGVIQPSKESQFGEGAKPSGALGGFSAFSTTGSSGQSTAPAPAFSFGQSGAATSKPSGSLFQFGLAPATSNPSQSKPTFSFGSTQPAAEGAASKPFSFGTSTSSQSNSTTPSQPMFKFGSGAAEVTKPSGELFSFGSKRPSGAFGIDNSSEGPASKSAATTFNFGNGGSTDTGFKFGSSSTPATGQTSAAPFQFGSQPTQVSSAPFQFGSGQPPAATSTPFQFGASASQPGTSQLGGEQNTSGRTIKKAVRRKRT